MRQQTAFILLRRKIAALILRVMVWLTIHDHLHYIFAKQCFVLDRIACPLLVDEKLSTVFQYLSYGFVAIDNLKESIGNHSCSVSEGIV